MPGEILQKEEDESFDVQPQPSKQTDSSTKWPLKEKEKRQTQIPMMLSIKGGRSPSHGKAAINAASNRIDIALQKLGPEQYLKLIPKIPTECYDHAVIIERDHPGAGVAHIQAEMGWCANG